MLDVACYLTQVHETEIANRQVTHLQGVQLLQPGLHSRITDHDLTLLKIHTAGVIQVGAAADVKRLEVPALGQLQEVFRLHGLLIHVGSLEVY